MEQREVAVAWEERSTEGLLCTDGQKNDSTEMVEVIMVVVVVMRETEEKKGREAGRRKGKKERSLEIPRRSTGIRGLGTWRQGVCF